MTLFSRRVASLLFAGFATVAGIKDSIYYSDGWVVSKPSVRSDVIFSEAGDLLAYLSAFDALYVKHHNCVWSAYESGCGAEGENDEYWYMELAPCFRANAAFSLYGILKGHEDLGCSRKTYINSFATTNGIETFTNVMVAAGMNFTSSSDSAYPGGVSSTCEVVMNDGNENGAMLNDKCTSYGVSCTPSGHYKKSFFRGGYCSYSLMIGTSDDLKIFNEEISGASCVPIFKRENNCNGTAELEGGGGGGYGGYDTNSEGDCGNNAYSEEGGDKGNLLSLLNHSRACSVIEFPNGCPDPYGMVLKYERALQQQHSGLEKRKRLIFSSLLMVFGVTFLSVPLILALRKKIKRQQQNRVAPLITDKDAEVGEEKRTMWQRTSLDPGANQGCDSSFKSSAQSPSPLHHESEI